MSRKFLEQAGFDPDEPLNLSTEVQCGALVRRFLLTNHDMPADEQTVQDLVDQTNFYLEWYGQPTDASVLDIQMAISTIQSEIDNNQDSCK